MSRPAVVRVFRSALAPGLDAPPSEDCRTYVVIADVLRATTTLIHAFASGARSARAFASIEAARAEARRRAVLAGDERPLLCGEKGGRRIKGFDLGNSPSEYTPEQVRGRDLLLATTNGAPAIHRTAFAAHQFVCAFVNLSACADALTALALRTANAPGERELRLVAAGEGGRACAEDDALVGALAARLLLRGAGQFALAGEDPRPFAQAAERACAPPGCRSQSQAAASCAKSKCRTCAWTKWLAMRGMTIAKPPSATTATFSIL